MDHLLLLSGPGIRSAQLVTTGETLSVESMRKHRWKISGLPEPSPPAVKIEFENAPYLLRYKGAGWLEGELELLPDEG